VIGVRDLAYVRAVVEVTKHLPMRVGVSPHTGLLELRLGNGCPVILTMDRAGRQQLEAMLHMGRDQQEKGRIDEPEAWFGRYGWQDHCHRCAGQRTFPPTGSRQDS
jgi:hypothetical protein